MIIFSHLKKSFWAIPAGLFLFAGLSAQVESNPLSEIFFLDLGIVIEPVKETDSFSRVIKAPSKEVAFRLKKVESGAVYMASSKEMLTALDRINDRLLNLENSFNRKIEGLKEENANLVKEITLIKTGISDPLKASGQKNLSLETKRKTATPENIAIKKQENIAQQMPVKINILKEMPKPVFDQSLYMSGVFAYQREDYQSALVKFSELNLDAAPARTAENILYWMADALQNTGDYNSALKLLNRLKNQGELRIDDALIQSGILYRKLGQESLALAAFSDVVANHPQSEYRRLAQMELKKAENLP